MLCKDFSSAELVELSSLPIVPIVDQSNKQSMRRMVPSQCYFGGEARGRFHSKLFVFVDFGQQANSFLSACGAKREPSVEEIASMLLANPHQFYELADGRNK